MESELNERGFLKLAALTVIVILLGVITALTSWSIHRNECIVRAIEAGNNPVVAAIAFKPSIQLGERSMYLMTPERAEVIDAE